MSGYPGPSSGLLLALVGVAWWGLFGDRCRWLCLLTFRVLVLGREILAMEAMVSSAQRVSSMRATCNSPSKHSANIIAYAEKGRNRICEEKVGNGVTFSAPFASLLFGGDQRKPQGETTRSMRDFT